ncbi:MAG: DNA-processing protein DprA [Vicinamibacteria bacterium]
MKDNALGAFEQIRPDDLLGPRNDVERKNAPEWLLLAGDRGLLRIVPRVSIVGTRTASSDGLNRASRLARELVAKGVIVVSGLARGIDAAAHLSAIEAGGRTVAVLGTSLDKSYPRENADLQRLIMEQHLAVSQFPSGHPIERSNFPRRNRTMALLTDATVIAEAADGSGCISQGWEALRLGRRLFIMRAVVENKALSWPSEMLKYGADILTETEDLLQALPVGTGGSLASLTF